MKYFIAAATAMLALSGCNKFLNLNPADKVTDDQLYSTEQGTYQVLNGIYYNMADNKHYGAALTMSYLDVMAQYYDCNLSTSAYYAFARYNYTDSGVKTAYQNIWTMAYKRIIEVNDFIAQVSKREGVLTPANKDILLGEAYGLRAFLHFDMLRLFGPVYCTTDSTAKSIPYETKADGKLTERLAANRVVDLILADLSNAERLLAGDPVITSGTMTSSTANYEEKFYRYRNYRFNYYAVKAIQARVDLYRGNKVAASAAANVVIAAAPAIFPFVKAAAAKANYPDRIYYTEVIFGLENRNLYSVNQTNYFSGTIDASRILQTKDNRLNEIFDSNAEDYRLSKNWFAGAGSIISGPTFYKYAPTIDTMRTSYFEPLIRVSEMYYIAAECASSNQQAWDLLRNVRYNRGITDMVAPPASIPGAIQGEYTREFFGEGQLFFYYKRLNFAAIPVGYNLSSVKISMDATKYVVPLPDKEQQYR